MARSAADVITASRRGQAPTGAVPTQTPSRGKLGVALRVTERAECTCAVANVKYAARQSECNAQQSNLRAGGSACTRSPPASQDFHSCPLHGGRKDLTHGDGSALVSDVSE